MRHNAAKAAKVLRFLQSLKHTQQWHGVPFRTLEWQAQIIWDVFGTVRDNGYRQFNYAWVEIPKKNGKSEFGAGLGLYLMAADNEPGAEVYGAASDRAQASVIFDRAVEMVDQCPAMKKKIKLKPSQKRMIYLPTRSFYQVLSGEVRGKQGYNTHAVLFDEIHEQPNRHLYDTLTQGSGDARRQPLFLFMTTAGDDPDRKSIAWALHKKAERVIENPDVDRTWYAVIYGVDEDADSGDETNWYKANPALGEIIDIEKVRDQYRRSQDDPDEMRKFRQFRLNQWVKDKAAHKWIKLTEWDDNAGLSPKPEELKGQVCYAGLDLSTTTDLTALVLVFPPTESRAKYAILPFFWIPEENMKERVKRDLVPYDRWKKQGFLTATPGDVVDYDYIEATVEHLAGEYEIRELGYDPYKAMQTAIHLQAKGITMVPVRQGWQTQDPAMTLIEVLVKKRMFQHGGHPVLRWNMGNAECAKDAKHNKQLIKGKDTERVDGAAALINAIARVMLQEGPADVSEFAQEEFLDKLWGGD